MSGCWDSGMLEQHMKGLDVWKHQFGSYGSEPFDEKQATQKVKLSYKCLNWKEVCLRSFLWAAELGQYKVWGKSAKQNKGRFYLRSEMENAEVLLSHSRPINKCVRACQAEYMKPAG